MDDRPSVMVGSDGLARCYWCAGHADYVAYHDFEWGRPVADDARLFEKLCLEGFQSGLSWLTVLRKRDALREAFAGFDIDEVARFGDAEVARIVADPRVIRHQAKIRSVINNAQAMRRLQDATGAFASYLWSFAPEEEAPEEASETARGPTRATLLGRTEASTRLAKDLKARGFTFVGPTTAYALMQSIGVVNDHMDGCFLRDVVERERTLFQR